MKKLIYFQFLRAIIVASLLAVSFFLVKYSLGYIYPFVISFIIAFILHPIVSMMEDKLKMNRGLSTFIVMISFFIIFSTSLFIVIKQLLKESTNLLHELPNHFTSIQHIFVQFGQTILIYYEKLTHIISFLPQFHQERVELYVQRFFDNLGSSSTMFLKNIVFTTSTLLSSITYISTVLLFVLLASFIMTKDFNQMKMYYEKIIPVKLSHKMQEIMNHLKKSVFGLIKAQVLMTFFTSIIVLCGLMIFKVENVITITITVFIVDFIPYVGVGLIFIPWILYAFFSSQYILTVQLAILYIIIIIFRQIIEPKLVASSIGIHPLVAIIILFVGIQSLGLFGFLITPLLLMIVSAIYHAKIIHFIWYFIKNG